MSNYEKSKKQAQELFLSYDQEKMIQSFGLGVDNRYLFLNFCGRRYRINRKTGLLQWSEDGFQTACEGGFDEAMTVYDILSHAGNDWIVSGNFQTLESLSRVKSGGSSGPGNGFFRKYEQFFDTHTAALERACIALGGFPAGKGDVAFEFLLFPGFPARLQFWNSDEEFPASLHIFYDEKICDCMHYETLWYTGEHLLGRLREIASL